MLAAEAMPSGQLPCQFSQTEQLEDSVTKHGRWGPKTGGLKSDAKGTPVPCTPIVLWKKKFVL